MKNFKQMLFFMMLLLITLCGCQEVEAPDPISPLPQEKQVNWQKMERIAFIHFGLNTFNDKEWGYGDSDLQTFNPTAFDAEQWVRTLKQAGMQEIVITAKHHDGFCLWPTHLTEYCVRNTPFRDGNGDVVGELEKACRKYNMKMGIYLSPWDRNQSTYGTPDYVEYFYKQLTELLTQYGEITEVWFDGANGGDGYYGGACEVRKIDRRNYYNFPKANQLVADLQPDAVVFSDGGPGCRWCGNEQGIGSATNWSFLRSADVYPGYDKPEELPAGHEDGDMWCASELDTSIRPGWFYHEQEDSQVKSVEDLVELYYQSVGHNGVMMLNIPPDQRGLIHPIDSVNVIKAYQQVQRELRHDILAGLKAKVTSIRGGKFNAEAMTDGNYDSYWSTPDGVVSADVEFEFPKMEMLDRIMLQEYIPLGQRVKSFAVEYWADGDWKPVDANEETTTIGYKRILRIEPISTERLRIRILDARGPLCINYVGAFYSKNPLN